METALLIGWIGIGLLAIIAVLLFTFVKGINSLLDQGVMVFKAQSEWANQILDKLYEEKNSGQIEEDKDSQEIYRKGEELLDKIKDNSKKEVDEK